MLGYPDQFGPEFAQHVESFRDADFGVAPHLRGSVPNSGRDLENPKLAQGWCGAMSDAFRDHMAKRGVEVGIGEGIPGHLYNTYRGHAIDWTMRQFDPSASVPHVEPETDYVPNTKRKTGWKFSS